MTDYKNAINNIIRKHERRLLKLKEKKAEMGINTPVEILTEIEDIEEELERLRAETPPVEPTETDPGNIFDKTRNRSIWADSISVGLSGCNVKGLTILLGSIIVVGFVGYLFFSTPTSPAVTTPTLTSTPTKESCEEENTLERIKCTGIVRVGFANEQPYAFAKPDGTLSGESIEVARVIFNRLGISEIDGVVLEFESLIPALQAGRFDIITAGMWIQPERCEQVLFANPEYRSIVDGEILFGAAAFRKEDTDLRDAFNAELKKLKDSGELENIITQFEGYVGDETSAAGYITANEICNSQ